MTYGYLDELTARFLAELKHWWDSFGGLPPALPSLAAPGGPLPATWKPFKLKANFDCGGTVQANPMVWSPAASGSRTADTSETKTLVDALGIHFGLKNDIVWAVAMGSANGVTWEIRTSGPPRRRVTLTAALVKDGSAAAKLAADATVTLTVWDDYLKTGDSLANNTAIGASYDTDAKKWYPTNARCG